MSLTDTLQPSEIREVLASFDEATKFEDAIEIVEKAGIDRLAISMIASHDAVKEKLGHRYRSTGRLAANSAIPTEIFSERRDIAHDRALATGVPLYIGGIGAGLAIVASGGSLAFAAVTAAVGAAAGAGIGTLLSSAIGKHHAHYLEQQLAMGRLLVCVEVKDNDEEGRVINLLKKAGGQDVHARSITRFWDPAGKGLNDFDPAPYAKKGSFS